MRTLVKVIHGSHLYQEGTVYKSICVLGPGEPNIYQWMMVGDYFISEDRAIVHCKHLYNKHSKK